ncbi:hypothetical protein SAY87_021916 [Trapa incisa]|uniref:Uncharacterized protein n=1 Tax=Trapa incisa TaxID=236973 RepID=A0AAN7JSL9_9MYRT|nr:hypothetical protein SAY87_021916 [Trapa incisa]
MLENWKVNGLSVSGPIPDELWSLIYIFDLYVPCTTGLILQEFGKQYVDRPHFPIHSKPHADAVDESVSVSDRKNMG